MKRTVLFLCLLALVSNGWAAAAQETRAADPLPEFSVSGDVRPDKLSPPVRDLLAVAQADELLTIMVVLESQADLEGIDSADRSTRLQSVVTVLQETAQVAQADLRQLLQSRRASGDVSRVTAFWIFNGLVITAKPAVIEELGRRPEVAQVRLSQNVYLPDLEATRGSEAPPEANLALINAPSMWELGFRGENVVIATMDSGAYLSHPDLIDRWRGGSNSWYDPYGEHPIAPVDMTGHGTGVMGVALGGDAGGSAIGVAPEARWVAVRLFDDRGMATEIAIHEGFQWLLDPDGDPTTPDAPHVVTNSWVLSVPGCQLTYQPDLTALRAAGILPIFSAGNSGPEVGSSRSPANNPEAFPVGAVDNNDQIYWESARGPSACESDLEVYPALVAPGVEVRTADLYGTYQNASGTSLSAPHVAGALALLLSADPDLTVEKQELALVNGAVDLGLEGPDNDFGHGRLDVLASYQWLQANPDPIFTIYLPLVYPPPMWNGG